MIPKLQTYSLLWDLWQYFNNEVLKYRNSDNAWVKLITCKICTGTFVYSSGTTCLSQHLSTHCDKVEVMNALACKEDQQYEARYGCY